MANYCAFMMKITGEKKSIKEIIEMMKWKGRFSENGLGRIYDIHLSTSIDELDNSVSGIISCELYGGCAWSVLSAMRDDNGRREVSLESESKRLDLVIEVFSEETGMEFQEHVLIDKGEVLIDECVDYQEHFVGDHTTIQQYNDEYGTDFTEDMVNDEHVYVGGFDNYGVFKDHSHYFNISISVDDLLSPA